MSTSNKKMLQALLQPFFLQSRRQPSVDTGLFAGAEWNGQNTFASFPPPRAEQTTGLKLFLPGLFFKRESLLLNLDSCANHKKTEARLLVFVVQLQDSLFYSEPVPKSPHEAS